MLPPAQADPGSTTRFRMCARAIRWSCGNSIDLGAALRKGLVDLVAELEQRQVHFKSLTDGIDTKTPAGRFFLHVMASLAQMERELIAERTRAGLAAARKLGRVGGQKRRMTDSKIASARKLLQSGAAPRDVAHDLCVSILTLYRWLPASART